MSASLEITGLADLEVALKRYGDKAKTAGAQALFEEAEAVMAESKEHYVPVDVTTLKNSGHVRLPVTDGDSVSVTLGYGGAAQDYAVIQHERLDFHHEVGEAKYLERPLLQRVRGMTGRIAGRIRELVGG